MTSGAKPTPLEILVNEFLPAAEAAAVESRIAQVQDAPLVQALADLKTPVYGNDPNELIKHRWLYRGAMALFCGPTGIGKSAFLLQGAMHWSVGRTFLGFEPGDVYQKAGMRILIVQAENDDGDMAEMRDGVLAGCDELNDEEKAEAGRRVFVATVNDKSSDLFAAVLDHLLAAGVPGGVDQGKPYDMAIVDPAFAYLGGDGNSQKEVSRFMREMLNPMVQRRRIGLIVAHHTNKPLRGKEKDTWEAGDYAYLGAGSAEWINPVRAAFALRSVGSDSVFEGRAVKRGKRLRWVDDNGNPTTAQHFAHDRRPGVICWHKATPDEVDEVTSDDKGGRPKRRDDIEAVHAITARPGDSQRGYVEVLGEVLSCGHGTAVRMIKACVQAGWLREAGDARFRRYEVTDKGSTEARKRPSVHDWRSERSTSVPE